MPDPSYLPHHDHPGDNTATSHDGHHPTRSQGAVLGDGAIANRGH